MHKSPTTNPSDDSTDLARLRRAPTHPGMLLAEFLRDNKVSTVDAARRMSMSVQRLNDIRLGKRRMTPETCVQVGALTNTRPEFWGHLQMRHDVWHAMHEHADAARRIHPIAPDHSPHTHASAR